MNESTVSVGPLARRLNTLRDIQGPRAWLNVDGPTQAVLTFLLVGLALGQPELSIHLSLPPELPLLGALPLASARSRIPPAARVRKRIGDAIAVAGFIVIGVGFAWLIWLRHLPSVLFLIGFFIVLLADVEREYGRPRPRWNLAGAVIGGSGIVLSAEPYKLAAVAALLLAYLAYEAAHPDRVDRGDSE